MPQRVKDFPAPAPTGFCEARFLPAIAVVAWKDTLADSVERRVWLRTRPRLARKPQSQGSARQGSCGLRARSLVASGGAASRTQAPENSCLGRLDRDFMNVERSPEKDADVPLGSEAQDLHLRMPAKQCVTRVRQLVGVIEGDNQEVRMRAFHGAGDFLFVL